MSKIINSSYIFIVADKHQPNTKKKKLLQFETASSEHYHN